MGARTRHILSLSGGKDSAALAVYLKDRIGDLEYVFCDTKKELPETYEYLARLEAFLGRPIVRLNDDRGFDHWLQLYGGYLPSSKMRWCTRQLKIKPFERYVGEDEAINYIGIRADEDREGYISTKPNLSARYPFKEDGLRKADVLRLLEEAGLGLPSYYRWRSRSGCYFCFFQRKIEWVGLMENHPDLFAEAKAYEKVDDATGTRYSWQHGEMLSDLAQPRRIADIRRKEPRKPAVVGGTLGVALGLAEPDPDEPQACLICSL
ncbi:MAG: phosphoadenosine phosphosulfate reductase family protein [Deltaproteobacteria bacterium]|nr:phosphoadenosine phosphosulfate reductase family protein [Deltaproteobacteria bacterium]